MEILRGRGSLKSLTFFKGINRKLLNWHLHMDEGYEQFLKQHNVTLEKILRDTEVPVSTVFFISPVGKGER